MTKISIKRATAINALAKYSTVIMTLFFTTILSRILTPDDYGIVAIVTVFTSFFSLISDMGIGTAIIQNKELSNDDISNIFGFSLRVAIVLALIFCVLSVPISIVYNNDVYILICCILSISIFFNTLNMVPNALLMKDKRFLTVGKRTILVNLITGVFTITFAMVGFKYYSLVLQSVMSAIFRFIWNYKSTKPKIKFIYERNSIDKIKSYSGFQFAFNIVNYLSRNLDNLLIGKFIGSSELAYYNKGYSLMLYPINNLTFVITPVLHPILSDYHNDKLYIYNQYIKIVKILSLMGVFVTSFSFVAANEIILIMFGSQWDKSVISFKILALSIIFQMTVSSAGSIYLSLGDTKNMFKSGVIYTFVMMFCITVGVSTGDINTVALFVTIGLIFKFFIDYYFLIHKCFEISVFKFYKNFIPDFIILLIMFVIAYFSPTVSTNNMFLSALYKLSICTITFVIGLFITKQYKYFILILPVKFKKSSRECSL